MKSDIEIAREGKKEPILKIAKNLNIPEEKIKQYGTDKAKISLDLIEKPKGKLILVTSTNPTPYGEGKTTMVIGLTDGLCKLGENSIAVLREPSLGPVFGVKGGATGGGYAQVVPMEEINLHFTGDIHAIESCNNLLCALIDNHIFQGNSLQIDPTTIQIPRAMDINDRALRHITIDSTYIRQDQFVITTASEIMAILCMSEDLMDLKEKLKHILIGYSYDKKPIFVSDLQCEDALTILLKEAIQPNLVQTLEHNPVIIHGGPFANIAHGCNSIIATRMALSIGDYVVTEAGFGSDLGAFKFMDLKCRNAKLKPDLVIINTTIRSLKYNGTSLETGIQNLQAHIDRMKLLNSNIMVCLNQFNTDTEAEIAYVKRYVENQYIPFEVCLAHSLGSNGAISFAKKVVELCKQPNQFQLLYSLEDTLTHKLEIVLKKFLGADEIIYEKQVLEQIVEIEKNGFDQLPLCVAKTQYSITDDPKKLGYPTHFSVTITDLKVKNGAGFLVVYLGNIMTMPGLSKEPAALKMKINQDENISGLF